MYITCSVRVYCSCLLVFFTVLVSQPWPVMRQLDATTSRGGGCAEFASPSTTPQDFLPQLPLHKTAFPNYHPTRFPSPTTTPQDSLPQLPLHKTHFTYYHPKLVTH